MPLPRKQPQMEPPKANLPPCWREILADAFSGLRFYDRRLEQMLDYLERTS